MSAHTHVTDRIEAIDRQVSTLATQLLAHVEAHAGKMTHVAALAIHDVTGKLHALQKEKESLQKVLRHIPEQDEFEGFDMENEWRPVVGDRVKRLPSGLIGTVLSFHGWEGRRMAVRLEVTGKAVNVKPGDIFEDERVSSWEPA